MESDRKKSGGVEIPKGKRSLDLKGVCESQFSKPGGNKRKVSSDYDQKDVKKKKGKIPKEVPLSSFVSDVQKCRKTDVGNDMKSELGSSEKPGSKSKVPYDVSLPLGDNGNSFHIPKRRRGSVGRKRPDIDHGSQSCKLSNSIECVESLKAVTKSFNKVVCNSQSVKSAALSVDNDGISNSRLAGNGSSSNTKSKKKVCSKSSKDSSSSNVRRNQKAGDEVRKKRDGQVVKRENRVVNHADAARNKMEIEVGRDCVGASIRKPVPTASIREPDPTVRTSGSNSLSTNALDDDDDDEDDEENLEQNAARMLSSRFDPSCSGYTSKRKSSVSQTANELIRKSISQNVEPTSGGDNLRSLRPKRGESISSKGVSKKRRHFYEVLGRDVDPYWVLKRRIKIFWPLDDSWYEGIVNNYRSKAKLHHIKYNDRDEEWVNLEEEKFKLLLLRSEVPGKEKSRKQFSRDKNLQAVQIIPPEDDDSSTGNSLDSEPIALWLASQSQRVKALPKSPKRLKTSEDDFPVIPLLASEKTDVWNDDVDSSEITGNKTSSECASAGNSLSFGDDDKPLPGMITKSDNHLVYVRKKNQKKFPGSRSVLRARDANTCRGIQDCATTLASDAVCSPTSKFDRLTSGHVNSDEELWVFGDKGKLALCNSLLESKEFKFRICLPLLPCPEFTCRRVVLWLLSDIFWLQHGVIVSTSPSVFFEMLLIDNNLGFRLILYEGCLKQALTMVFEILNVFGQYDEQWNGDKLPVTSIRFQLSSVHDRQKQHIVAAYCFSRFKRSMWFYPKSQITQRYLPIKQFCLSECTDDTIKNLECQILQPLESHVGFKLSSSEDPKKKLEGHPEACNARMNQSLNLAAEPAKVSLLNLHLHSLVQKTVDATCSKESAEQKCDQPIARGAQVNLSPVIVQDIPSEHEIRKSDACGFDLNSSPMGSKKSSKCVKNSRLSSPIGINSPVWSNGKPNFMPGPKKPRTQVQYSLPLEGYDISRKQETFSSHSVPFKRIRRASVRRTPDVSGNSDKNMELQSCSVNALVTSEDRGWREYGGQVFLEVANDNEWRLAVKLSGVMRFSYTVKHILQPGSANRYSHAMMWKGGKDWVLEFPERGQWTLFKEMYEECYNRNIRAASVKNIPIPGVRPVDEYDDYGYKAPFVRNPTVYFRQVQSDAELAMDPSRVLYDIDSDDEQWLMEQKICADKDKCEQLSANFLERAMDMFEKVAFSQHREDFSDAEVEELAAKLGPIEVGKLVYLHWRTKRKKIRMPLIRHFQPPPWERYQQQLKEWEQNFARGNCAASVVEADKDKPPMFAFCLKPRGLDVPDKGSKQRSHKKFTVSGNYHVFSGDQDSPRLYGRRPNGHAFGGQVLYLNSVHEYSDNSHYPSARIWSGQNGHFSSTTILKVNRKISKNKHRRRIAHLYNHGLQAPSESNRTMGHKNGVEPWELNQVDISNLDELHLRAALGAAQHTCRMAKFKRDKAQRLLYKADLAIQKAVYSLMNAEAMKHHSFENLK